MINIDSQLKHWIQCKQHWKTIKQTKKANQQEYDFICTYYNSPCRKMWSSMFGELLVRQILINNSVNILPQRKLLNVVPDIETDKLVIEVKTRNYTTSGTAGEKILGAPFKYCEVYANTGKYVYIVLVGYQEKEAKEKFMLSKYNITPERRQLLSYYWKQYRVRYIFQNVNSITILTQCNHFEISA